MIQDSWVLWASVHDENGMPGSSGEHLVLMSMDGEVNPGSSPCLSLLFSLSMSFSQGEPATVSRTFSADRLSSSKKTFQDHRQIPR